MIEKEFTLSDIETLGFAECDPYLAKGFLELINSESLGRMFASALEKRKKGHFNDALKTITEVNKQQFYAISEIQRILDESKGQKRTDIFIEKFRQIMPFQIGITNGDQVLDLLGQFYSYFENRLLIIREELHQKESELNGLLEEYKFMNERMKDRITDEELEGVAKEISSLSEKVYAIKSKILSALAEFVSCQDLTPGKNKALELTKLFYLLLTSNIEILDAKAVEV